jgi:hypothetical protein
MVASSNANRPITTQMSNTYASALSRGLDTATAPAAAAAVHPAAGKQQQQQRRRLSQLVSGNNTKGSLVLLSPDQAFGIIRDGAYRYDVVSGGGVNIFGTWFMTKS